MGEEDRRDGWEETSWSILGAFWLWYVLHRLLTTRSAQVSESPLRSWRGQLGSVHCQLCCKAMGRSSGHADIYCEKDLPWTDPLQTKLPKISKILINFQRNAEQIRLKFLISRSWWSLHLTDSPSRKQELRRAGDFHQNNQNTNFWKNWLDCFLRGGS